MATLYVAEVLSADAAPDDDGLHECWTWLLLVPAPSARAAHAAALSWAAVQIEDPSGPHRIVGVSNLSLAGRGRVDPLPGAFARRRMRVRAVWDRQGEIVTPVDQLDAVVFEDNAPDGAAKLVLAGGMAFDQVWRG